MTSELTVPTDQRGSDNAVPARQLRRWIRQRRRAARGGPSLNTWYVALLSSAVALALLGPRAGPLLWRPETAAPAAGAAAARLVALLGLALVALYGLLRGIGPLALSRAHLTWLFRAPVSRRELLLPALLGVVTGGTLVGLLLGLVAARWLLPSPFEALQLLVTLTVTTAATVTVALAAVRAQLSARVGRPLNLAVIVLLLGCTSIVVDDRVAAVAEPVASALGHLFPWTPGTGSVLVAVGLGAMLTGVGWTYRSLDQLSPYQVEDSSLAFGTFLDTAYALEPSFLADLRERRYWRGRALRSAAPWRIRWLPILAGYDLLILSRKRVRLAWLAGFALLPVLASRGSAWLLGAALLLGALAAADTTMSAVRRDTDAPALTRLLGLTDRQVLVGRLVVPTLLAATWSAIALAVLALTDRLPAGPWWVLGLALGPAAAAASLRRARSGSVRHDLPVVETPMGAIPSGPIIWALSGPDLLLLLTLPALGWLLTGAELTWANVLTQALLAALGPAYQLSRADR